MCSYIQYSAICARLLRNALKPELREAIVNKEVSGMKVAHWENGQMGTGSESL